MITFPLSTTQAVVKLRPPRVYFGSNPAQARIFFRPYFRYYLSGVHYGEDRFHNLFKLSCKVIQLVATVRTDRMGARLLPKSPGLTTQATFFLFFFFFLNCGLMKTRKTKLQYVLTKNVDFQPCIVGCNSHFIIIF